MGNNKESIMQESMAVVSSDGTVLWIPPSRLESSCSLDLRRFPFDEQTCVLKFGSWTFDGNKVRDKRAYQRRGCTAIYVGAEMPWNHVMAA